LTEAEQWQEDSGIARAALRERFPNLRCLRCAEDHFSLRVWRDESIVPALADETNNRMVELICENCGLQERHVVNLLAANRAA